MACLSRLLALCLVVELATAQSARGWRQKVTQHSTARHRVRRQLDHEAQCSPVCGDGFECSCTASGRRLFGAPRSSSSSCSCVALPLPPPPPARPPPSAPPAASCQAHYDLGQRASGLYTIHLVAQTAQVWCDMTENDGAYTLVARIVSTSRKHLLSTAYGTLTSLDQATPWKLRCANACIEHAPLSLAHAHRHRHTTGAPQPLLRVAASTPLLTVTRISTR